MSSILLKEKAVSLRKRGFLYSEIQQKIGNIPKATLFCWFKNISYSNSALKKLKKKNRDSSLKNIKLFNSKRSVVVRKDNVFAFKEGKEMILSNNDKLMFVGVSLFWAEGTKARQVNRTPDLRFTNSDREMIIVFMKFLRKYFEIHDQKLKASIQIHENCDRQESIIYWSKITKIPKDKFYIINQKPISSKNKRPKNSLPYGTITIRYVSRYAYYKMLGAISSLSGI
jgi:hypothetical protein